MHAACMHSRNPYQCTGAHATRQRRVKFIPKANTSYQPGVLPPPPPPPPPPSPPSSSRRGTLVSVAAVGAAVVTGLLVFNVQQQSTIPELGITVAVKSETDQLRKDAGFKRDYEGRVWLQARNGVWFEIRVDAKLPGTVLLRDSKDSFLYYVAYNDLQQIDLTDDNIVLALFGDGLWDRGMQHVQGLGEGGVLRDVQVDREDFRTLMSIMQ